MTVFQEWLPIRVYDDKLCKKRTNCKKYDIIISNYFISGVLQQNLAERAIAFKPNIARRRLLPTSNLQHKHHSAADTVPQHATLSVHNTTIDNLIIRIVNQNTHKQKERKSKQKRNI